MTELIGGGARWGTKSLHLSILLYNKNMYVSILQIFILCLQSLYILTLSYY